MAYKYKSNVCYIFISLYRILLAFGLGVKEIQPVAELNTTTTLLAMLQEDELVDGGDVKLTVRLG